MSNYNIDQFNYYLMNCELDKSHCFVNGAKDTESQTIKKLSEIKLEDIPDLKEIKFLPFIAEVGKDLSKGVTFEGIENGLGRLGKIRADRLESYSMEEIVRNIAKVQRDNGRKGEYATIILKIPNDNQYEPVPYIINQDNCLAVAPAFIYGFYSDVNDKFYESPICTCSPIGCVYLSNQLNRVRSMESIIAMRKRNNYSNSELSQMDREGRTTIFQDTSNFYKNLGYGRDTLIETSDLEVVESTQSQFIDYLLGDMYHSQLDSATTSDVRLTPMGYDYHDMIKRYSSCGMVRKDNQVSLYQVNNRNSSSIQTCSDESEMNKFRFAQIWLNIEQYLRSKYYSAIDSTSHRVNKEVVFNSIMENAYYSSLQALQSRYFPAATFRNDFADTLKMKLEQSLSTTNIGHNNTMLAITMCNDIAKLLSPAPKQIHLEGERYQLFKDIAEDYMGEDLLKMGEGHNAREINK